MAWNDCGGQRTSSDVEPCLPPCFRKGPLLFVSVCDRPASLQTSEDSHVSVSCITIGIPRLLMCALAGSFIWNWDLNSGPLIWMASTLFTEPSPQPQTSNFQKFLLSPPWYLTKHYRNPLPTSPRICITCLRQEVT